MPDSKMIDKLISLEWKMFHSVNGEDGPKAVSYTHLDVYKRQAQGAQNGTLLSGCAHFRRRLWYP